MVAAGRRGRKRRREMEAPRRQEPGDTASSPPAAALGTDAPNPNPTLGSEAKESPDQEPPPPPGARGGGEEEDGVDRINGLPDGILGDIISLLPTKDGARTQTLAFQWRHLWPSTPLNLDHTGLLADGDSEAQVAVISGVLAAHRGPARRLSVPANLLLYHHSRFSTWLGSPALDSLQQLELEFGESTYMDPPLVSLPASAFRFSATLRVLTVTLYGIVDAMAEGLHFPRLRQLGLEHVMITKDSLHGFIAGCPALDCLLLNESYGFSSLQISSPSLRSVGLGFSSSVPVIIEDAPLLERLLLLDPLI
ncbi:hypothetical protein ACP4OV_030575 [Aristida adscensionis]